jgi:tRNA (cmo5U34)-methyltransferase
MPKFTFASDEEGFDEHIQLSIRGYSDLWGDILKLSEYFVEDETTVVDIGCSTGKLLKAMQMQNNDYAPGCIYKGIEVEEDFFPELVDENNLQFSKMDVRGFEWNSAARNCSLVTSIFTLQFITKRDRSKIISRIYDALIVGGGFIFAEKILSADAQLEEMMTFCHYDWKRKNFSEKEILEKENQLRHMMKLLTYDQMTSLVKEAGFIDVQPFWQNFNFVACIALKRPV